MDWALDHDALALALGQLPEVPSASRLQELLGNAELALFTRAPELDAELVRAGWYLHAVGSVSETEVPWERRRQALRVSAHILELAAMERTQARPERLQAAFASAIGYRRGDLDPNATAVFERTRELMHHDLDDDWWPLVGLEAGLLVLSFRTEQSFNWLRDRRAGFRRLRGKTRLPSLKGTMFGPSELIVEGCVAHLRFLMFGETRAFDQAQEAWTAVLDRDQMTATLTERWVAAHLVRWGEAAAEASIWNVLPPSIPTAAKRALTATAPPVLALWEPQRAVLRAEGGPLDPTSKRSVLTIPTSAGKTLIAQVLVLAALATDGRSVCLVAPQRSLVREIRRALGPRVRSLRSELGRETADFDSSVPELDDAEAARVDVLTPERFAQLLRTDPLAVLARYGLFIFDEAHLVGDPSRGFALEAALSYLHWRTRDTDHRLVLMSAAIGNDVSFQSWVDSEGTGSTFRSEWRGPRRLLAAYSTAPQWLRPEDRPPQGLVRTHRIAYPLRGKVSFTIPGRGTLSYETRRFVGETVFRRNADGTRGPWDSSASTPHYQHVAELAVFIARAGPVLTVRRTRADAQLMASAIAERSAPQARLRRLRDAVAAQLDRDHPLTDLVTRGVAYHHAGLPTDVLALLEDAIRDGRLTHLVSTTTLTEGVNLPVRTVLLAETAWSDETRLITGPKMLNAIGRAGRAGVETEGWVIFAPSGRAPNDPAQHLPTPEDLVIRSRLSDEESVAAVEQYERERAAAADSVFGELGSSVTDFTTFVWGVLACEEAIGGLLQPEQLDEVVSSLLVAIQRPNLVPRLRAIARDVLTTYAATAPDRRRVWARAGTSIRTARLIDGLADRVAAEARAAEERATPEAAVSILEAAGALTDILTLPEVGENAWRFRLTTRGADVEVDMGAALRRWLVGDPIATIADALLADVPNRKWRVEQMVDAVSRGFGHVIAWMVASILDRANPQLEANDIDPLCPSLPAFIRYGIDSGTALELLQRGVRSRTVAVRIAQGADADEADDVSAWIATVPMMEWPSRFGMSAGDVRDVLDFIRDRGGDVLRLLLDGEHVEVPIDVPEAAELTVATRGGGDEPRVAGVRRAEGDFLADFPVQWQSDVLTLIATGAALTVTINAEGHATLAIAPDE